MEMNNVIIVLELILFVILFRLYFDIVERVERYKHYVDTLHDAFYQIGQINDNINRRTQNMISELISAVYDKKEEKKND